MGRALDKVRLAVVLGLPGVGKSALAQQFAAGWDGPVLSRRMYPGQLGTELLDELRRALSRPVRVVVSDGERVADLAELLDRDRTLLVIEDVDRLDDAGRASFAALAERVVRARVIATARSHVFALGHGPERLQLVLEGLDRTSAADLWTQLDELYGPRLAFDDAWTRSQGNPFYLRRAHAGDPSTDQLFTRTIEALEPDERELATALAVAEQSLPLAVAGQLVPEGDGGAAATRLIACLVVEQVARDHIAIHDLLRDAILRVADPQQRQRAHRRIAAALVELPLDPVVQVRERCRHLLASNQGSAARALVLGRASELVRLGGAGELMRCLDALPSDDPELRLARARARARMLDLRRAFDDLVDLGARRDTREPVDATAGRAGRADGRDGDLVRLRASLAHIAMLTGRYDLAERTCREALAGPLPPTLRIRYATIWVLTRTYQGGGPEARARLLPMLHDIVEPVARGYVSFIIAFSLWLEERDSEADEAMREAWKLLEREISVRATVLAPAFRVTVLARAGRLDEAHAALRTTEAAIRGFEDPLMQVALFELRATLRESEGAFAAALDDFTEAERQLGDGGLQMGVVWTRLYRGAQLLRLGRTRDGHALLDDVARDAGAAGAKLIVRLADKARLGDPRRALDTEPRTRLTRPGDVRRERVIAAVRAVAHGPLAVARGQLAALRDARDLDEIERALLVLAEAATHGRDGDRAAADAGLARATELAARAGADPELVADVARWLADAAGRTSRSVPLVVDRKRHTVRVDQELIDLRSRPMLRRLLYALLAEPERSFDKASLASALWPGKYKPERHDSALWVNLKRLRDLLSGSGLEIETEQDGYRLAVKDGYQLVVT